MLRAKANFGWYHVPRAPSDSAEGLAKFDKRFPVVAFWSILGDTWVATWARMRWITFSDSWTLLKLDFKFHPWFIIKKSDWFPKEFTLNSSKLNAFQGVSRGRNSAAFLLLYTGEMLPYASSAGILRKERRAPVLLSHAGSLWGSGRGEHFYLQVLHWAYGPNEGERKPRYGGEILGFS